MTTVYVCGRCGGLVVCICTTKDGVTTAHTYCEECDKKRLKKAKVRGWDYDRR